MSIELNVTVEKILYPPSTGEGDWFILVTSHGKAKGKMQYRPREYDDLVLTGEWVVYQGSKEFSFSSSRINVPVDPRDQLRYICIRTKGLGSAAESLLWQKYGKEWPNAEEGSVPRLKGMVYQNFLLQLEALGSKTEEAGVIATLIGKGATVNMATAAWLKWSTETLGVVMSDPFRLSELDGYSFHDVDKEIRRAYGIDDDDRRRIKAGVVYALRRLTDAGDTVVSWADLYRNACGLLGGYADLVSDCTAELFEDNTLKAFPKSEGVSLAGDWKAETEIWEWVTEHGKEKAS